MSSNSTSPDHRQRVPARRRAASQQNRLGVPFAVRRLVDRFGLSVPTAIITAEAAGLGERGR